MLIFRSSGFASPNVFIAAIVSYILLPSSYVTKTFEYEEILHFYQPVTSRGDYNLYNDACSSSDMQLLVITNS